MKKIIDKINKETVIFVLVVIFSMLLRKSMVYFRITSDYQTFKFWYDTILDSGGILALRGNFSNYPPLYLIFLIAGSYIFGDTGYKPYGIKGFPMLFDYACAFFVYKILRKKFQEGPIPYIGTSVFLLAPTVFINSAYWGQNDSMYLVGMLACIYFLIKNDGALISGKPLSSGAQIAAFAAFGWAFSIKLQAIFLAPFFLILLLMKKINWKALLIPPLVYLVTITPAWLLGRPFKELLLLYNDQVGLFPFLSMSAPSIYAWLPGEEFNHLTNLGTLLAGVILLALCLLVWRLKPRINRDLIIALAFLAVLITPFLLPKMHERYFFPADVFALLFGFYFPQFFFVPIIMISVSLFSFMPFLYGYPIVPIPYLAFALLVMLGYLVWKWREYIRPSENNA